MIYSLTGTLLLTEGNFIVIQCAGVGYKCLTSSYTQGELHNNIGKEVTVYTYMNVRQDAVDLFGFASTNELECFKSLTRASGIGAKTAQRIVLELKDKLSGTIISDNKKCESYSPVSSHNVSEALKALACLGYSSDEVMPIIAKMDSTLPVENLISNTLKAMAKGV